MVFIIAFIIVSVSYGNIFFSNNHYVPICPYYSLNDRVLTAYWLRRLSKYLIFKVFELLANFFLLVPGPCLSTFFIIKGVLDRSNIGRRENGKPWLSILKGGNT